MRVNAVSESIGARRRSHRAPPAREFLAPLCSSAPRGASASDCQRARGGLWEVVGRAGMQRGAGVGGGGWWLVLVVGWLAREGNLQRGPFFAKCCLSTPSLITSSPPPARRGDQPLPQQAAAHPARTSEGRPRLSTRLVHFFICKMASPRRGLEPTGLRGSDTRADQTPRNDGGVDQPPPQSPQPAPQRSEGGESIDEQWEATAALAQAAGGEHSLDGAPPAQAGPPGHRPTEENTTEDDEVQTPPSQAGRANGLEGIDGDEAEEAVSAC